MRIPFSGQPRTYPRPGQGFRAKPHLYLLALGLLLLFLPHILPFGKPGDLESHMIEAARKMAGATEVLEMCRESVMGPDANPGDINRTGLIGLASSPITTSIGNLEAKRTSTNPNMAGLVLYLLRQAGVEEGDVIAVGASGSFPALILATLAATEVMGVRPLLIVSIGASQWGANNPDFHWLGMTECLRTKGIFAVDPLAMSLGGDRDVGEEMSPRFQTLLADSVRSAEISYLDEADFRTNILTRLKLYDEAAGGKRIKAFINIGGSTANIGVDPRILELRPGLAEIKEIPPPESRGVLYEMAARRIPVIHLLFVRGLAERYGLPWDPSPLPRPGEGVIYRKARENRPVFLILMAGYVILVLLVLFFQGRCGWNDRNKGQRIF